MNLLHCRQLSLRGASLLLLLTHSLACQQPPPQSLAPTVARLVGEWTITAIQVSPQQNGTTDALGLANALNGNTCLNQLIIGFDPNNRFHLDYRQAPTCAQAKTDYVGYFTGLGGQQWSLTNDQLVLSSTGQPAQPGQPTSAPIVAARYRVSIQGEQMIWSYQVERDQQVDPNQTVFIGSNSIPLLYTITLQNVWRP